MPASEALMETLFFSVLRGQLSTNKLTRITTDHWVEHLSLFQISISVALH